jgi:ferredoxin-thioredoxin reductase catalytic chain
MEIGELRKIFEKFCENKDFQLNSDQNHADTAMKGVLENEKKLGFKFCPCQLQTGNFKEDIKLLCPCNFKAQKTWQEKGECWCGLFIKKEV